jgi:hypothetical protein
MAMNQRERYLAIGVGVVVGLFAVQYGFNSVRGKLQAKQDLVDAARNESDGLNRIATSGQIAARKLQQLNVKSLPTEKEALVAQYKNWLTSIALDAGMTNIKIVPPDRAAKTTNAYSAYNFTLLGTWGTDQGIELLAAFYDADYLHTLKGLKVVLTKVPGVVDLTLDAQALALQGAGAKQERSTASSGRLARSVEEYKRAILDRNPFSPPNQPPSIAERKFEIPRGSRWSQALTASDAEAHEVSFELVSTELPEGMDFRRGSFSWTPTENGEFEVVVKASDNGWPSKSIEEKLTFKVIDPPAPEVKAPEPTFDVATQAFVSALLSGRSGPEAWIRSRTEGKTLQLVEGSDLEIGSIKAKVVSINLNEDFIEFESDGAHWTIGMDTSLADAYAKSQID